MPVSDSKPRLDQYLADNRLAQSRSRARDAVKRGTVLVNGTIASRPGIRVGETDKIEIDDSASAYVSRAALKLKAGLSATGFDAGGRNAIDLGASTGGFTQVLLEAGAAHVWAIDVGHGQFAATLLADPRTTLVEGLNARDIDAATVGQAPIDCIVCDVSFISLKLALPPTLALARAGAWGIFLVKPQFELGRSHIGKNGVVRDEAMALAAAQSLTRWLGRQAGWRHTRLLPSPLAGSDGNREYLLGGVKSL
jgi:23S rRNA (cytidine1920-2'-O)/16S rRNA (cytidine1409-2'-O)-methyltransferase